MVATALASRLALLFRGLSRAHGEYVIPVEAQRNAAKGGKIEGEARTVRKPVTPEVWSSHTSGVTGLGLVPVNDEGTCYFSAIDIDVYPLDIDLIERAVAAAGLPLLPTTTKSGGVHLYLFTSEGVPASLVRQKLGEWTVALGYPKAEIFPKQDIIESAGDVGNWINLPYFDVDAHGHSQRHGVLGGAPLTLEQYCTRADSLSVSRDQLATIDLVNETKDDDFVQAPPCLQCIARNRGFVVGARNNGMFAVGVYLRKRYPDDWKEKLSYYNGKFSTPAIPESELKVIAKSVGKKKYNYNCDDQPLKGYCNRAICTTRDFGIGRVEDVNWGVNIDPQALKIDTAPPYWLVVINGVQVKFFSEDLQLQTRFQKLCMEFVQYMPPLLPGAKWNRVVNDVIGNAKLIAAPEEASMVGELAYLLEQFCTVFPQAETKEEILVGKPWTDTEEGITYFRAGDFKKYLESQKFHGLNGGGAHLYSELRELGVDHTQFWVAERNIRAWSIARYMNTPVEVPPRRVKDEGQM